MSDTGSRFTAREGDVLVVSYPEAKLPIPAVQYAMVTIGNLTYSRHLVEGDDPQSEYDKIYSWLRANAEKDGRAKIMMVAEEYIPPAKKAPLPPPIPLGAAPVEGKGKTKGGMGA